MYSLLKLKLWKFYKWALATRWTKQHSFCFEPPLCWCCQACYKGLLPYRWQRGGRSNSFCFKPILCCCHFLSFYIVAISHIFANVVDEETQFFFWTTSLTASNGSSSSKRKFGAGVIVTPLPAEKGFLVFPLWKQRWRCSLLTVWSSLSLFTYHHHSHCLSQSRSSGGGSGDDSLFSTFYTLGRRRPRRRITAFLMLLDEVKS